LYETSTAGTGSTSWYSDYSNMPYWDYPFFIRGGNNGGTTISGAFYFYSYYGGTGSVLGFRPVLAVSGAL